MKNFNPNRQRLSTNFGLISIINLNGETLIEKSNFENIYFLGLMIFQYDASTFPDSKFTINDVIIRNSSGTNIAKLSNSQNL